MKAFVMESIGEVGFAEKDVPEPGPSDAVVRTTSALICTSDTHTVHGAIGERENMTLGHEAVGVVEEVGDQVERFAPGDRVTVGAITPDWGSDAAQRGHSSQSNQPLGGWKFANVKDGVFADYFHVNEAEANMALIPEEVSDEEAVYTCDMMSTGFAGAEIGDVPTGGTVAVFGQGPVGLMATRGAELLGAGRILAVETVPSRQELARRYGADDIVDFREVNEVEEIRERTNGNGVDVAIEALGTSGTFENCIKVTKPGGTIANVGYHGEGDYIRIPREDWGVGMAEQDIRNILCPGGRVRLQNLLRLLKTDRVDPTPMTTHRFSFDDIDRGFEMMEEKKDGVIKPLIEFTD